MDFGMLQCENAIQHTHLVEHTQYQWLEQKATELALKTPLTFEQDSLDSTSRE
ncbi:hypothetical protein GCM10009000_079170 [Halobacterium noricense]